MPVLPLVASITVWPGFSAPLAFGRLDDAQGQPVLDRAHRIEGLELDEELDALAARACDLDDRRVADRLKDIVEASSTSHPPRSPPCRYQISEAAPTDDRSRAPDRVCPAVRIPCSFVQDFGGLARSSGRIDPSSGRGGSLGPARGPSARRSRFGIRLVAHWRRHIRLDCRPADRVRCG